MVPDPEDNAGLVDDCMALLEAGKVLAGSDQLRWSTGVSISEWEGVTVDGNQARVHQLYLPGRGLTGRIPPELGPTAEPEAS